MPVSLAVFRRWFAGERDVLAQTSDLESGTDLEIEESTPSVRIIAWEGEEGRPISKVSEVRPGQTLIVPASVGGWDELGCKPPNAAIDVADRAAFKARKGVTLRLHSEIIKEWPDAASREVLLEALRREDVERTEMEKLLDDYREELAGRKCKTWPWEFLEGLKDLRNRELRPYPGKKAPYVLRGRSGKPKLENGGQILLDHHLKRVVHVAGGMASCLEGPLREAIVCSAALHDYGKVDVRFQAWLRGGDYMAARYSSKPIAKSGNDVVLTQREAGLPEGFRHELLSLMFAEKSPEAEGEMRDLILHLVAAHHGQCRPFAPVIPDTQAECASFNGIDICKAERVRNAPHRLDRGVPDRFWRLTGAYGWWGLAYLEAMLRLADWKASGDEAAEVSL